MTTAYTLAETAAAADGWNDPVHGKVGWKTLFSADQFPSAGISGGIAYLEADGELKVHRHTPPEIYFVLEGEAIVSIDGVEHRVGANTGVFIPGDALHGIRALGVPVRFFYCFAMDRFSDVEYRF